MVRSVALTYISYYTRLQLERDRERQREKERERERERAQERRKARESAPTFFVGFVRAVFSVVVLEGHWDLVCS